MEVIDDPLLVRAHGLIDPNYKILTDIKVG